MAAPADLTRLLLTANGPDEILDVVADAVCETSGFRRSLILDVDLVRGRVRGRAGHGIPAHAIASAGGRLDDYPLFGRLAEKPGPLVVTGADLEPLLPDGCRALFEVPDTIVVQPLRSAQLGLLGVIFCDGGTAAEPSAASLAALGELSEIAALAFQHAVLLTQAVAFRALRERSRIAGELHDGVSQQLFAAVLDIDELRAGRRLVGADAAIVDVLAGRLETALQQLRAALVELVSGNLAVGRWGRRNAARLAPATLPGDARERRVATLRRGAVACQVVGTLLALAGAGASLL